MSAPMPILHRAMVCIHRDPAPLYAFVAAADHQHADRLLYCILPFTIGMERGPLPRAVFVMSEPELIDGAIGEPDTGDARLLEIGRKSGTGTPVYADPGRTLLLLPPPLLQRMQAAQQRARALS